MTRRSRFSMAIALALACASALRGQSHEAFDWFRPWIEMDEADIREMADRQIVSRTFEGIGSEIVVFFAGVVSTDPATFVDAVAQPERLWRSESVQRLGRFSTPPRLDDVEGLRLSERDVEAIRLCEPGRCDVKLSAASRQVFASHYINGSLALTTLFHDPSTSRRYIAYLNTMSLDGLSGVFGGIRRLFVARAAGDRGAEMFGALRTRIEHWRAGPASNQ